MKKYIPIIAALISGAAIGAYIAHKKTKDFYENIIEAELEANKKIYEKKMMDLDMVYRSQLATDAKNKDSIIEYAKKVKEHGYLPDMEDSIDGEEPIHMSANGDILDEYTDDIRIISPDDFAERDDYETTTLFYYADGVLTDDDYGVIDSYEELIGTEWVNNFGVFDEHAVYVRNDIFNTDYEILIDERKYHDINKGG